MENLTIQELKTLKQQYDSEILRVANELKVLRCLSAMIESSIVKSENIENHVVS